MINGIVLVYEPPEVLRDLLLFAHPVRFCSQWSYVIYMSTRQPSREERVGDLLATRSNLE